MADVAEQMIAFSGYVTPYYGQANQLLMGFPTEQSAMVSIFYSITENKLGG